MDEIQESKQKMDLKSTTKEEYKGQQADSVKSPYEGRHRSVSPFRFNATSTYSNNFISYGPLQKSPLIKPDKEYASIKFMGMSTYGSQFVKHGKVAENFDKQLKKRNILGAGGISILESTSKSTYKEYKDSYLTKPFRHESVDLTVGNSSQQFTTTYGTSFFEVAHSKLKPTLKQLEKNN